MQQKSIQKTISLLSVFLLAFLMTVPANPVAAAPNFRVYHIPVITPFTSVIFQTISPPGSKVVSVSLSGTYNNTQSGSNAAHASFGLSSQGTGWTVRGSDLGWSGSGTFSVNQSTTRFNGPIEGGVFWEGLTSALGNFSGSFTVVISEGSTGGPGHPNLP